MKRSLLVLLLAGSALLPAAAIAADAPRHASVTLRGAGATFPAPLYKRWISAYRQVDPSTAIDYAAVGSGEGIRRFLDDTVDFGASDAAMSDPQIAQAKHGAVLIPVTAGMVVLAYNLPDLGGPLKLSRRVCADLLLGRIKRWNDPALIALNPGLTLPDQDIQLVARRDSSGTTFALSSHLSAASEAWRDGPGIGKLVRWPANTMIVQGNEGVAARVKMSPGAIGYMEYGYAKAAGIAMASLENKAGRFVLPSESAGARSIEANLGRIPGNLRVFLPDPDGPDAYPIVSFSWLLLKGRYPDPTRAAALKRFVAWALDEGQAQRGELGFIPGPPALVARAQDALAQVQ